MKVILWFLVGLLVLLGIVAGVLWYQYDSMPPREKAEFWFNLQKRYPQGSPEEQWALQKAIDADPTFDPAWMQKSIAFNKRGFYAEGFRLLQPAVDLAPTEYLGYRGYVKLYMMRDYEGAIADLVRLDSLTPSIQDAPWGEDIDLTLGIAYLQLKNWTRAEEYFHQSITAISEEVGPDWIDVRTHYFLGLSVQQQGRFREAIEYFNKAIEEDPNYTEAHYAKGFCYQKTDQMDSARYYLRRSDTLFQRGYLYTNKYYEMPGQIYRSDIREALSF
jgi:tetratricopeptide (TPR) repeat protein